MHKTSIWRSIFEIYVHFIKSSNAQNIVSQIRKHLRAPPIAWAYVNFGEGQEKSNLSDKNQIIIFI